MIANRRRCHRPRAKTLMQPITQKSTQSINTKLGILAHHDKVQLQDKGHNSESCSFRVMTLFNLFFLSRMIVPDRPALVPHTVLLYNRCI